MASDKYVTSQTLLKRAQNQDDELAWDEFVSFYKVFICQILHRMNIDWADFDDLVQEVLLKLWKGLPKYDRDKAKFRTWLSHVTRNTVLSYIRAKKRRPELESVGDQDIDDFAYLSSFSNSELEDIFEKEWRAYLCGIALENIKTLFSGHAVEAFTMSQKGMKPQEIADALGITKESASVLASRVRSKFSAEVKKLILNLEF